MFGSVYSRAALPKEMHLNPKRITLYKMLTFFFSVLCVLCIFSGILGVAYLGFDPLVRSLVLKRLVLSNTSETFHIWENPGISPHFKVTKIALQNQIVNNDSGLLSGLLF